MGLAFKLKMAEERLLSGDLYRAANRSKGTLLICHGYKGFKDWGMFPHLGASLSKNHDVIVFNFSHNGIGEDNESFTELEKFAVNTYSKELEDLDFLVDAVLTGRIGQHDLDNSRPLYLLGHSKGAGTCLIYAMDAPEKVDGVLSWNGIADVDLFSEEEKRELREKGRTAVFNARTKQQMPLDKVILDDLEANQQRFDILQRIASIQVPVVLVQGSEDHERLLRGTGRLLDRNPSLPRKVIQGGNHTFNTKHPFTESSSQLEEAILLTLEQLEQWGKRLDTENANSI